jgi:hypothetical protein
MVWRESNRSFCTLYQDGGTLIVNACERRSPVRIAGNQEN